MSPWQGKKKRGYFQELVGTPIVEVGEEDLLHSARLGARQRVVNTFVEPKSLDIGPRNEICVPVEP